MEQVDSSGLDLLVHVFICEVQSGFVVVRVCVSVGWVLLAVQVWKCAGGEKVSGFGDTKRGQEINSKR